MRGNFILNYVVVLNDGVNEYFAEAGFTYKHEAIEYADKKASMSEPFNPSDSDSVYRSARVARYEVVRAHGNERDEEWETVYETKSFYNEQFTIINH